MCLFTRMMLFASGLCLSGVLGLTLSDGLRAAETPHDTPQVVPDNCNGCKNETPQVTPDTCNGCTRDS